MKRVTINLQHQSGGEDVVCTKQVNKQRGTLSRLAIPYPQELPNSFKPKTLLVCALCSSTVTKKRIESVCDCENFECVRNLALNVAYIG